MADAWDGSKIVPAIGRFLDMASGAGPETVSVRGEAVMGLLKELHDDGATICMVTHDPRYAEHAERTSCPGQHI